jgi:hypothetical protein
MKPKSNPETTMQFIARAFAEGASRAGRNMRRRWKRRELRAAKLARLKK